MPSWPPSVFTFADAPLASVYAPAAASVVYVGVVLCLNWYMQSVRKGIGVEGPVMRFVQAAHNLVLCLGSLVMMVGTIVELVNRWRTESPDAGALGKSSFMFCERPGMVASGALYFWSYVYYLSKYYELLDTVLQLLKGRAPPHFFLHVYHHSVVIFMAWGWCQYCQTLQWGGLVLNTAVHVLMYYYYFRSVLKLPTPWKRFVTKFQIIQFSISLGAFLVYLWLAFGPPRAVCEGQRALLFNLAFNVTLLYQFVGVLGKNGAREKAATAKAKRS